MPDLPAATWVWIGATAALCLAFLLYGGGVWMRTINPWEQENPLNHWNDDPINQRRK